MTTAARRLAGIGAVWVVLIGTACFDVSSLLAPAEAIKSGSDRGRDFRGELWASFQAGGVGYESSRIPFVAPLKNKRAEISAESVRSVLRTLKRVPGPNKSLSAPASPSMSYISDAAWQAYYDTGAANISGEAPPDDLYLTTSEMDALTGTMVYSQDLLGDGSAIAELMVERAPGSPYVTTTVTLNGQVMHTSSIDYQTVDGGYSKTEQFGTTYDRYGSATSSGTLESPHLVEYTSRPDAARVHYAAAAISKVWAALPQLLESIGPTTAYAAGCGMYTKHALMAVAAITVATMGGQWWYFVLGYAHMANSLHGYSRCMRIK